MRRRASRRTGNVDDVLKALFDPAQWAQAGLGPLDRAIEHLVDGPSYATLWTLDRKILRAQKLRAEWTRDLAAWQLIMQTAWNEALQRFIAAVNATGRRSRYARGASSPTCGSTPPTTR